MPFYDVDICDALEEDFLEYTGHVMQERSLPDARDGLKDGARKILYSQFRNKNDSKHNYIKGQAAVGRALIDGFLHGDASAYSTLVRMGKPYAVPYVLEDIQGNGGNQTNPDSHAAGRYLEIRQSELASYLFHGIEKNAIEEWYWNYSNTLELPRVLPSIGFYPIINGVNGISVGLSTSIPSTNLREVNAAIIKLIHDPTTPFEEIYCPPDFPMGGTIVNGTEVQESFRAGVGKAARVRAKLEYIPDKHMIVATQIPFLVYTDTIDEQLTELINGDDNPGIEKYIDATNDAGARINIYLSKGANANKIMQILYKKTSLESYCGINFIMLDHGRFPRVFPWKDALLSYITHIRGCKQREIQFDLDKALARKNIVDGLIKAYSIIDEVVALIRSSSNPNEAAEKLINVYEFNEEQAKAILAMRLSSLTKLDIVKLTQEREQLIKDIEWFQYLLNIPSALDEELVKVLQEVAAKYGNARRTVITNTIEADQEIELPQEEDVVVNVYKDNTIKISLKDGDKRKKIGADVVNTIYTSNMDSLAIFTNGGRFYNISLVGLNYEKPYSLHDWIGDEQPILVIDNMSFSAYKHVIIVSKHGFIKKTETSEYTTRLKKGIIALKLEEGDIINNVFLSLNDNEQIVIINSANYYNCYALSLVSPTGRTAKGVRAIKLKDNEQVINAIIIREDDENPYRETGRCVRGEKINI